MKRRPNKLMGSVIAALLGTLVFATVPIAAQASTTPHKAASHALIPINITEAGSATFRLSLYVADYDGLFRKYGLAPNIVEAASGTQAADLLAGGQVQFEIGQVSDAMNDVLAGIPVDALASITNRISNSELAAPKYAALIKKEGLKALANVPIGITGVGSGTWEYAKKLCSLGGLSSSQCDLVSLGGNAVTVDQDLIAGRVGYIFGSDPVDLALTGDKQAIWLSDEENPAHGVTSRYPALVHLSKEPYIFDWAFTTKTYAASHPAIVQDFTDALVAAQNFILHHSLTRIAKTITKDNPTFRTAGVTYMADSLKRLKNYGAISNTVIPTVKAFDNAVAYQAVTNPKYNSISYSSIVDPSFARAAQKKVGSKS